MATDPYAVGPTEEEQQAPPEIRTRAGYLARDALRAFLLSLGEKSPISAGQAIHLSADLVTSGALDAWQKQCWDYAFQHIGLANPRVLVYLKKRIADIDDLATKFPNDILYQTEKFQHAIAEIVLVLQGCPKRQITKFPKVNQETHTDTWFQTIPHLQDSSLVRRVWVHGSDDERMRIAANYILKACADSAIERALFWFKWLQEEDSLSRKENKFGLTALERGTHGNKKDVGHFLAAVLAEAYKEWAARNLLRMHEEFQTLLDLWRSKGRRRTECIVLMILILAEVPKWKVPASPPLVTDPISLGRAVAQAPLIFKEVLSYAPAAANISKSLKPSRDKKEKKGTAQEEQLENNDKMFLAYYGL